VADAPVLRTERLLLRGWRASDREPFAAMNADPRVMEHFPAPLTAPESDAFVRRIEDGFARHGFGLWAVEVPARRPFIGFVGLSVPSFDAHFTPAVEVGWRLDAGAWGRGYATEAAAASVAFGFEMAGLDELVSFTVPANVRSIAVMRRLGMTHDARDDFDHPRQPAGSPLRRHVLYRISREAWRERAGARAKG
jgi:ribosomal-protein-alanine N-acetyltransferase